MNYKTKKKDLINMIRFSKEIETERLIPNLFLNKENNGEVLDKPKDKDTK
jgi:hypothetical protein